MLGVRMWRGSQQTAVVASSGIDMPINTASALGEGIMEMKSQDPKISSSAAGFNSTQNSPPLTLCYAEPPWAGEEDPEDPDDGKAYVAGVAALAAGAVVLGIDAEL